MNKKASLSASRGVKKMMMPVFQKLVFVVLNLLLLPLDVTQSFSVAAPPKPIPITVLSGFLGSGKTTLLQHLLHNKEGKRIGIIVNDVASINIDSKLISTDSSITSDGMVQLENGCACCSLSEELLSSISQLITLSDLQGRDDAFDHIVIELSGVGDPKAIRSKFQEAALYGMPLMDRVQLDTMVTVIDASAYLEYLQSEKLITQRETPELFREEELLMFNDDIDEQDKDLIPSGLWMALGGSDPSGESSSPVADLLVSQTEICDVVVLNKCDLVDQRQKQKIENVVEALNPRCRVLPTTYGDIQSDHILAVANGRGIAECGIVDDHRDAVLAVSKHSQHDHDTERSHSHSHDHSTESVDVDPKHNDHEVHSHSHAHTHAHADTQTHDHTHHHDSVDADCQDPDCTDTSHSHSHEHSVTAGGDGDGDVHACTDPDCTDTSHSHSHDHALHAGIGTFVYTARRPFHPQRLLSFLRHLPIVRGLPDDDDDDEIGAIRSGHHPNAGLLELSPDHVAAISKVLRSKGFTWCADSNLAALYWSHASTSFELQCLGRWWATLPRDQWPLEAIPTILADFDDDQHDDQAESPSSVGDRRQEVVLIGLGLGKRDIQQLLEESLGQCLLDDNEWELYQTNRSNEAELKAAFGNPITTRMATF